LRPIPHPLTKHWRKVVQYHHNLYRYGIHLVILDYENQLTVPAFFVPPNG
jgi:hypothetical protein